MIRPAFFIVRKKEAGDLTFDGIRAIFFFAMN